MTVSRLPVDARRTGRARGTPRDESPPSPMQASSSSSWRSSLRSASSSEWLEHLGFGTHSMFKKGPPAFVRAASVPQLKAAPPSVLLDHEAHPTRSSLGAATPPWPHMVRGLRVHGGEGKEKEEWCSMSGRRRAQAASAERTGRARSIWG